MHQTVREPETGLAALAVRNQVVEDWAAEYFKLAEEVGHEDRRDKAAFISEMKAHLNGFFYLGDGDEDLLNTGQILTQTRFLRSLWPFLRRAS
jgi:hypothetical protein